MVRLASQLTSLLALAVILLVAAGCDDAVVPDAPSPEPATLAPAASDAGAAESPQASTAATPPPTPAPSPTPEPSPVPLVSHGSRDARAVALTFDDGWSRKNVLAILAILERERVPATFFPVAAAVRRSADTWRAVAAAGYPIGNHSGVHKNLTRLSVARVATDLAGATQAIEEVTGRPMLPVLRPPYGAVNRAVRSGAAGAGIQVAVTWDVDSRDWTGLGFRKVAKAGGSGQPGSVVLFHCDDNTVKALPRVIARYKARGFRFVTVGQMFGVNGTVPDFPPDGSAPRSVVGPAAGPPRSS